MTEDTKDTVSVEVETKKKSGTNWGQTAAWVLVLALLALVGWQLRRSQLGTVQPSDAAPEFTINSFDGQTYTLSELRGKVVVVNFWASWCTTCREEAANLQTAWEYYQPRGDVLFLGSDYVDTEPEALAYIAEFGITYPNGPDLGTRMAQAYRIQGVPETYIIDQQGNIAFVKIGPFSTLQEIYAYINPLLEQ